MRGTVFLNNGIEMPKIGIGGWAQKRQQIVDALSVGYRLIDTATQYRNEEDIGMGIRMSGVAREDIFLTTKLWTEDIRQHRTREAFEESLRRLGLEYIDLFLIHWPADGFEDAWLEMEKIHKAGKARAIGVSNFELHHLNSLENHGATVVPAINQIESHPYFSNEKIIMASEERGIRCEAWCPLGGPAGEELRDPQINQIAMEKERSSAQIILRWQIQRGVVAIPKSSNKDRMRQNTDIFDFELSNEDMDAIDKLECGMRLGAHPDHFDF